MDIKELIEKCVKKHIAHGYKYVIETEASEEVIDEMKKNFHLPELPEGMTEDSVFRSIGGFCSYREESGMPKYAEDCIYIFVEGIQKSVEKFKKMGSDLSFESLVEFCVLHECRHSQQVVSIREAHLNPEDVFKIEKEKYDYSKGPMENDANKYALEFILDPEMERPYEGHALNIIRKENKEEFDKLLAAV